MIIRMSELKCREVINICDGCRVGFVSDLELDCTGGNVVALIVPGRARFFGLFGREDDYIIPWGCICRMGNDIILVEIEIEKVKRPVGRKNSFEKM